MWGPLHHVAGIVQVLFFPALRYSPSGESGERAARTLERHNAMGEKSFATSLPSICPSRQVSVDWMKKIISAGISRSTKNCPTRYCNTKMQSQRQRALARHLFGNRLVETELGQVKVEHRIFFPPTPSWLPPGRSTRSIACCKLGCKG